MSATRRALALSAGVLAVITGFCPPAHAATGFAGTWTATDVSDGSAMTLSLRGPGPHFSVHWVDAAATVCGGARATISGDGWQDEDFLFARVTLTCNPGGNFIRHQLDVAWQYDANTDTLSDPDGNLWERT